MSAIEQIDERIQQALDELQTLILGRYPQASFAISHGEDPEGIYLDVTVDLEDVDEVIDAYGDRLLDMQVEEGLPVYVIPLQPVERVLEQMRSRGLLSRPSVSDGALLNP